MSNPLDIIRNCEREPLLLAWPSSGNPGRFLSFATGREWHRFIDGLGIDPRIPDTVQRKFDRAQRLYLLGWLDFSLIKAGELAALIALELTVMDRYGGALPKRQRSLTNLLKHMGKADGLIASRLSSFKAAALMVLRLAAVADLDGSPPVLDLLRQLFQVALEGIWVGAGDVSEEVEYVQVKGSELDKYWSIADLCANKTKTSLSIFEASQARDRHCEPGKFRIVTLRPVYEQGARRTITQFRTSEASRKPPNRPLSQ